MATPLSPSALKAFSQCPYKFYATYIGKTVEYHQGEAAARGERLHDLMEHAINERWDAARFAAQWDDAKSRPHAERFAGMFHSLMDSGWAVRTEYAIATDGHGGRVDFWDKTDANFMRCRIDVMMTHPDSDVVLIFDHKTGRRYESDRIQLQVNAACLVPYTGKTRYTVSFDYLDSGDLVTEDIDVSGLDLSESDPLRYAQSPCPELAHTLAELGDARKSGAWAKRRNRFCRWCGATDCEFAGR